MVSPEHKRWLACLERRPAARLRLYCIPFAGGGLAAFRAWPAGLPGWIEVWAARLPGRDGRFDEPPILQMEPLVQGLVSALSAVPMPFALFGHSMGALLAFEAARLLEGKGGGPVHVVVSGRRAPHLPRTREAIYDLPRPELVERLRAFEGTPEAVLQHPELMEMLLPLIRADLEANDTHVFQEREPLRCALSAFGGVSDPEAPFADVSAWRRHTSGRFHARAFPGHHFFIDSERPQVLGALAELLAP